MKYIANIITEKELSNHEKKEWINYVMYQPHMSGRVRIHMNMMLPTLIVGWDLYKREFSNNNPDILNKNPNIRLSWEFSMEEKMTEHFKGVENFVKEAPRKYVEIAPYRNVDPIKDNIQDEPQLIEYLDRYVNLFNCNIYIYKDEIIYLFDRTRLEITGIYLNSYRYFGYNCDRIKYNIIDRVRQNQNNRINDDTDGSIYQSYYKKFPEFDQLKRSIVLFLS